VLGLPGNVLKLNDAAWVLAETDRTPMQVGVLASFSMPDGAGPSYLEDLFRSWREVKTFQPPFNYVLRGPGLPRWKQLADDQIDLDYHLRHSAVPSPGGERELGVLVSRLHSARMNRKYPLWECHVIEGVAPGKWSLYIKVHHSQIDGVGGIRLAKRMFSIDPDRRDMLPPWAVGTHGPDQSGIAPKSASRPAEATAFDPLAVAKGGASVAGSLARTFGETFVGPRDDLRAAPYRAPHSVLNGRINAPRRFATQNYDMERMRKIGSAAGGSINDVFLTVCGGALRRYMAELGQLPDESLTANVPVSVRAEGEAQVGNAITFLYAKLGTDVDDPVERFNAVRSSTQLGKQRLPKVGSGLMDAYTTGLMGPFLGQAMAGVGGFGSPAFNIVVSNVPGFREERYFDGSKLEEYYPLSLLFHGQALNITGVSNDGSFCIGYTGCRDTLPSLQKIAVYSGEALDELESAVGL